MSLKQKGVLLHFSSLPGDFGIGDLGPEALSFAQFLNDQGHTIWQTLPLNHRGYGNSPYNPISAFALDPLLISPELLYEKGLVDAADLEEATIPATDRVFFEHVFRNKCKLLETAANRYLKSHNIDAFI
ncbi:MAG: 4-alpha-glucanotransferase, partial [Candidatus Cloacimonetes bacterium]|nr:4-alpha-glucanotransferase [Candidatus Cloacimonadota bacterium]